VINASSDFLPPCGDEAQVLAAPSPHTEWHLQLNSNTLDRIFLYLFLLAIFLGTLYFVYKTWITTLFPQKARGGKGGERARKSLGGKKVDPSDQVAVTGADGPAVTSGAKAYDESWIPAHHLQRPEAKRVKSAARPKSRGKPEA